jgi:hypothetical protein
MRDEAEIARMLSSGAEAHFLPVIAWGLKIPTS